MKEHLQNSDPEKEIFRKALGSLEIEPSEKFWYSALNGIIDREKSRAGRRIRVWKTVAMTLGALIMIILLHDYFTNSRFNRIETELSEMRASQTKLLHDYSSRAGPSDEVIALNQKAMARANTSNAQLSTASGKSDLVTAGPAPLIVKAVKAFALSGSKPVAKANIHAANKETVGEMSSTMNENITANRDASSDIPNRPASQYSDNTLVKNQDVKSASSYSTASVDNANNIEHPDKVATNVQGVKPAIADSAPFTATAALPKPGTSFLHRFSLGAFFAPASANNFLKSEENESTMDESSSPAAIKARENYEFACNAGIRAGFDISKRWLLRTGLYYNSYTFDIRQTVLTAKQQDNGTTGYSILTSSGIVHIPYSGGNPNLGDSIKVKGSSNRSYLCIPLQLGYYVYSGVKFRLSIIGGIVLSMSVNDGSVISWQNTGLQDGTVAIQNTEGINTFVYGSTFGVSASYLLGKGVSLFAEPEIQAEFSSANNSLPIRTYPYFLSLGTGICYHF
ncbi:MAG: outer membrane beta-barrel protein [Bacteroidia bacterium]|jgi:hypothetical protein|nr:outer membrane beta-barrel protein [Bacteroidia bacterium]